MNMAMYSLLKNCDGIMAKSELIELGEEVIKSLKEHISLNSEDNNCVLPMLIDLFIIQEKLFRLKVEGILQENILKNKR